MSAFRNSQGRRRNRRMELPPEIPIVNTNVTLNNGAQMPVLGYTAAISGNEGKLKTVLQTLLPKHGLEREDIFIIAKLSPSDLGCKSTVERAYQKTLDNLGLEYVDLYLINFPGTPKVQNSDPKNIKLREMAWRAMTDIYDDGRVNGIGVANFTLKHLKQLEAVEALTPTINQVEWHPYYYQSDLLGYCNKNAIILQAYGCMGSSENVLLHDPVVVNAAQQMKVLPAQLLLRWALMQDMSVISRSTDPMHIKQNVNLNFRIPDDHMKALNSLGNQH